MKQFQSRVKNILIHPRDEWKIIKEDKTTSRQVIVGYVAVLAAVPLAVSIIEALVSRFGVHGSARYSSLASLLVGNVLWYPMIILDVIVLGAIVSVFVLPGGIRLSFGKGLKLAAYSSTPLFLVGLVSSVPKAGWLQYAAILYSVYLLFLGIGLLTDIKRSMAVWYATASFMAAGVIIGMLNLLEYMLESYLARTLIFSA